MPSQSSPQTAAPTSSSGPYGSATKSGASSSSWTPKPIRILFSHFPLQTLPPNRLPSRSIPQAARRENTLFLFTIAASDGANAARVPSFNPTCLKWQTYLLTHGVEFRVRSSSNHASPSGSLPFLLPAAAAGDNVGKGSKEKHASGDANIVTASAMRSWTLSGRETHPGADYEDSSAREMAYLSLIDHRLRPAWLHSFYLTPNLDSLAVPLYIHTITTSALVRSWQTMQLRKAALVEVRKSYPLIEVKTAETGVLYAGALKALEALETLLGDDQWFFGSSQPGLLDAAVFSYVHLVMDNDLGQTVDGRWHVNEESQLLRSMVEKFPKLRQHRDRMLGTYFT